MGLLRAVIVFVSLALSGPVLAETIPAYVGSVGTVEIASITSPTSGTLAQACSTKRGGYSQGPCDDYFSGTKYYCGSYQFGSCAFSPYNIAYSCPANYSLKSGDSTKCVNTTPIASCPANQNWTLSGTGTGATCSRPDCVSPEVRDISNGQCIAPPCVSGEAAQTQAWANAWVICLIVGKDCLTGSKTYPSTYCDGSCTINVDSANNCYPDGTPSVDSPKPLYCTLVGKKSGSQCSANNLPQPGTPPTIPNKTPPCLPGEGVMTSSSGSVKCVPPGTPSAEPPIVTKNKSTNVAADGTVTETIKETTRDPTTGAESSTTTTKVTPPGCAGPSCQATSVSNESKDVTPTPNSGTGGKGDQSSDFCAKNPNLQMCKGGMNEEKTQKEVLDAVKGLGDPGETGFDAIKDAKHSDQSQSDLDAENAKFESATKGDVSPGSDKKSAFADAMNSGWFDGLSRAGCSPYQTTISGKTWTLDVCPVADKVASISEYVIWFLLTVGVFVMLTGGKREE